MKTPDDFLLRCVDRLRALPFVEKADLAPGKNKRDIGGLVRVVTQTVTTELIIEAKRTHLTRTLVDGILAQAVRHGKKPWILFAPHVGRPLARYLDEQGVNFVDLAGNCRLQIGRHHLAMIEGRPPERGPRQGRGTGAPGQQVLFALLIRPDLVNAPVRTLAEAAGVSPATAAGRVDRLRREGLVHEAGGERRLTEPGRLLDQWLKGYETIVRPKLLIGRYRARELDPEALERRIEEELGERLAWAFGGATAEYRLTGYYRGPDVIVHVHPEPGYDVAKHLRALKAEDGPLVLMRAPGPVAFEGEKPHTVAPLLVYTELLFAGDRRAREAAVDFQKKYLGHLQ